MSKLNTLGAFVAAFRKANRGKQKVDLTPELHVRVSTLIKENVEKLEKQLAKEKRVLELWGKIP